MDRLLGYHVVCRLRDSRVIAPSNHERCVLARVVLEQCQGARLLAFNAPDNHLHIQHCEDRATSGRLTQRVQTALKRRLGLPVGFATAQHEPIKHNGHRAKAFDYIFGQQPRHGLSWDPPREASNLPDLLGLRIIGQHTATDVRSLLPRVNRAHLLAFYGLTELSEATSPVEHVIPATLFALGRTTLNSRAAVTGAAWRAMMHVLEGQLTVAAMARLFGVARQTLFRRRGDDPNLRLVRAIRLQLGVRRLIGAAPAGSFVE